MSKTGRKRKFAGTAGESSNKSQRADDEDAHRGRIDPTFGQRSAFPGLDEYTLTGDASLDHDDELGALDYLRSVREEASSIPTLLAADNLHHDRSIYEDGFGDSRGWYSDGAYIAAPSSEESEDGDDVGRDPRMHFYQSLISKYEALRARLNQTPPKEIQDNLDLRLYPTHAKNSPAGAAEWINKLRDTSPNIVQLALLHKWSVLRILALLTNDNPVLRRGTEINKNTSLWLWGLLARLPDAGELNSEQISIVRQLGKKAILVRLGLKEVDDWNRGLDALEAGIHGDVNQDGGDEFGAEMVEEDEVMEDQDVVSEEGVADPQPPETSAEATTSSENLDLESQSSSAAKKPSPAAVSTEDAEAEDLAAARARALGSLSTPEQESSAVEGDSSVPSKNTRIVLEMILTVAGEAYGQRDLLEFRETWDDDVDTSQRTTRTAIN